MVITVGSRNYSLCSVSSSLSHATLEQPFRTLTNKVRGKILLKKSFCVFLQASILPAFLSFLRLSLSLRRNYGVVTMLHEHVDDYETKSPQDSSQYSCRSQQCCSLDGLHMSSYFRVPQSLYQSFGDCTKSTNNDWYVCPFHVPQFFLIP